MTVSAACDDWTVCCSQLPAQGERRASGSAPRLEDLVPGALVGGVVPGRQVTAVAVSWHGSAAVTLTYRDQDGRVGERLLYRSDEAALSVGGERLRWTFDADGETFTLVSEARRIRLAHLFDPLLAVHLSRVEPLPHQIRAVYGEMLPHQPLRFVLADDPGAGKTIMAGLYIKELLLRSDVARCLVVVPGGLVTQWQDELAEKFGLEFENPWARGHRGQPDRQPIWRTGPGDRPHGPPLTQRRCAGPLAGHRVGPGRGR